MKIKHYIHKSIAIAMVWIATNSDANTTFSLYGEAPKYKENIKHRDDVNPRAPKAGHMILTMPYRITTKNPLGTIGMAPPDMAILVYDSLFSIAEDDNTTIYGILAKTIKKDKEKLILTLEPRARWHDKTPITSADVKYTMEILQKEGAPYWQQSVQYIVKIETPDKGTLVLELQKNTPQEAIRDILLLPILPKHQWEEKGIVAPTWEEITGSGAYRISSIDIKGKDITYARVEDYWAKDHPHRKGMFNADYITYKKTEENKEYQLLKAGYWTMIRLQGKHLKNKEKIKTTMPKTHTITQISHKRMPKTHAIVMNTKREGLKTKEERQVIAGIWNEKRAWVQKIWFENWHPITSLFQDTPFASNNMPRKHTQERITPAKPFLMIVQDKEQEDIALILKEILGEKGIKINIERHTENAYREKAKQGDYDIIISDWYSATIPGEEQKYYWHSNASKPPVRYNKAMVDNPNIDRLLEKREKATDMKDIQKMMRQLDAIVWEEAYILPLFYDAKDSIVYDTRWRWIDMGTGVNPYTWWYEEEK